MKHLRTKAFFAVLLVLIAGMAGAQQRRNARNAVVIPADVELIRDVEYGKGGGKTLTLDIVRPKTLPKDPMPVVIFVHGGGWRHGSKEPGIPHIVPLAKKGFFCAAINYRLSGEAIWPAQIEDCKCAVRWMRAHAKEYSVNPDRIGVWGSSAGGHLVAMLGTAGEAKVLEGKGGWEDQSSRVQAVCDFFGPTDFMSWSKDAQIRNRITGASDPISELLGGKFWQKEALSRQASPITYVSKDDPPFLICHGDKDPLVPVSQSQIFHDALKKAGVDSTLNIVKGAGHGFRNPEVDEVMVADFFNRHLREGSKEK